MTHYKIGTCHWCKIIVFHDDPHKTVLGDADTIWHLACYRLESKDHNSVWYDDPIKFLEDELYDYKYDEEPSLCEEN